MAYNLDTISFSVHLPCSLWECSYLTTFATLPDRINMSSIKLWCFQIADIIHFFSQKPKIVYSLLTVGTIILFSTSFVSNCHIGRKTSMLFILLPRLMKPSKKGSAQLLISTSIKLIPSSLLFAETDSSIWFTHLVDLRINRWVVCLPIHYRVANSISDHVKLIISSHHTFTRESVLVWLESLVVLSRIDNCLTFWSQH